MPHPLRTIWLHPRSTVRQLIETDPSYLVTAATCMLGVGRVLDRGARSNLGDTYPLAALLVMACIVGPIAGLLQVWIYSHLLRWTAKWLGGTAPREHIKTAIVWGMMPGVAAVLLWIPEIALYGIEMFQKVTPAMDQNPWPIFTLGALQLIAVIYGIVLMAQTLAEVQAYRSAWRGFANLLLAGLVILIPAALIAVGIVLLR